MISVIKITTITNKDNTYCVYNITMIIGLYLLNWKIKFKKLFKKN